MLFLRVRTMMRRHYAAIALCLLMLCSLWYMHHVVYLSPYAAEASLHGWYAAVFDVAASLLLASLAAAGRKRATYVIAYVFLLFWILSNIIYSRFFGQYVTFAAFGELSNFRGTWWVDYIRLAFRWSDMLLLAFAVQYAYLVRKRIPKGCRISRRRLLRVVLAMCAVFAAVKGTAELMEPDDGIDDFRELRNQFEYEQEKVVGKYGVMAGQLFFNAIHAVGGTELAAEDIGEIGRYIAMRNSDMQPLPEACRVKGAPNVTLIIVESYLSQASQTVVDGKEVTPRLNALMREQGVYSNLQVASNRGAGESSDAQVSYFTGLIPLQDRFSLSYMVRDSVVAIPRLMRQRGYHTYITLPTALYFWRQNEANAKYGISHAISAGSSANGNWCHDDGVFDKVMREEPKFERPSFHTILTLSMHGPHFEEFLKSRNMEQPFRYPSSFSHEYRQYLDKCWFADRQIGRYIDWLKERGEYGNTVIIVCADHEAHEYQLKAPSYSPALPLVIANSGIPADSFAHGRINQIDLFPTMLDMFSVKSEWRGMGRSLLRKGYTNKISAKAVRLSSLMQQGDYFRAKGRK